MSPKQLYEYQACKEHWKVRSTASEACWFHTGPHTIQRPGAMVLYVLQRNLIIKSPGGTANELYSHH